MQPAMTEHIQVGVGEGEKPHCLPLRQYHVTKKEIMDTTRQSPHPELASSWKGYVLKHSYVN